MGAKVTYVLRMPSRSDRILFDHAKLKMFEKIIRFNGVRHLVPRVPGTQLQPSILGRATAMRGFGSLNCERIVVVSSGRHT
jgi:hypothetical protein